MEQASGFVAEGTLLWEPSPALRAGSEIGKYLQWLAEERGRSFDGYQSLWRWSVDDLEGFWSSIWEYYGVNATPYESVLSPAPDGKRVEGARWFRGAAFNYAEHALRRRDDGVAIIAVHESGATRSMSFAALAQAVGEAAEGLRKLGVGKGDSVVGYLPNVPEAVIAMLATASAGAAWSSCPPEFGTRSVIDRFQQLNPKVLFAADGYTYNGKPFDCMDAVREIQEELPTLSQTVLLPYLDLAVSPTSLSDAMLWADLAVAGAELRFEPVAFDHPLLVVYSSGTTGAPKAIVHGHGGALLEHLKVLSLHMDVRKDDRFFWFSTTGWIMWNIVISGLLLEASIVLYDGSPAHPDMYGLWRMVEQERVTHFGISAPYILGCMKARIEPAKTLDMSSVRCVGSTGAPLPPEGFAWVYDHVGDDLLLASISGGTDVLTAFVAGCPLLPVHAGEMQCAALGCKVEAFDDHGRAVADEVGELVITEPMPSMPVKFLNDPGGERYHESYFDVYHDVWRHGDWLKVTPRDTYVIYGRSDSTLNRSGVRMGTSEFYRVVEDMPEIADSLVIDTSRLGAEGRLLLFIVLKDGAQLDDALRSTVNGAIRHALSPRHVPDAIHVIAEVPRTLNGKKLEVPVKKILNGEPAEAAVSKDALANPGAVDFFVDLAGTGSV